MEFPKFFREPQYEYFKDPKERNDIFQFSKELAQYLHEENIPNIIFVDRAPRPGWVGLDEYWKIHYKDTKRPNIYFINPDSFNMENSSGVSALDLGGITIFVVGDTRGLNAVDAQKKKEFEDMYPKLAEQKDKPLALFDNCMHTGATIQPVLSFFQNSGYDVRLVIADDDGVSPTAPKIDATLNYNTKYVQCYPFGTESGVYKSNEMSSHFDPNADREKVVLSREEIRKIIRNKGK